MKKSLIVLLLLAITSMLSALEITSSITAGNLVFDKNSTSTVSAFSGTNFAYGGNIYGEDRISDSIVLKAGLFYDPVLRYTVNTLFEYQHSFFKLGVGPFTGIFNTAGTTMKSGLSTSVRVEIPGIIFASLTADSSIGARFVKTGDYIQEKNVLTVGYYIPNALCSVSMETKSFVTKQGSALEIDDSFTEYAFKVDVFQKNIAFKTLLSFAYQSLSRTYLDTSSGTSTSNTINSLVFGTDFSIPVSNSITLLLNLDSNIYSFGYEDSAPLTMPDSGIGLYLFRATTGITIKLN